MEQSAAEQNRVNKMQAVLYEVQNRQDVQQDAVCDTSPPAYTELPSNNGSSSALPTRSCTPSYPLLTKYASAIPEERPKLYGDSIFIF
jgi:hypothetical protein